MEDCLVPKTSNFYAALQKRPRHRGPQRREGAQRSGSGEQDQARPSSRLEKRIHREGSVIFDAAREDTAREKLESERKKTASLEKMIGKLTMKVEFLKKKSSELLGPDYASQYGPCPFDE